ncbi:MAG: 50S ribosomal protein L21 [Bacilli bacterium]|nr:50S ribosomal protein L21 [Bacilli bacterium]
MYAIIETGGKQLKVKNGDHVFIEKINADVNELFIFKNVLCVFDDNKNIEIGFPYITNYYVTAIVEKHGLSKKIRVFKYKAKNNDRKTKGHRQKYTKLKIKEIVKKDDKKESSKK